MLRRTTRCFCLAVLTLTASAADILQSERESFLAGINAARGEAVPLRLSEALCRIAQARAEDFAQPDRDPRQASIADVARPVAETGYDARFLSEVFVQAEGDVGVVLEETLEGKGPLAREIARGEMRDLGVGLARRDETPLYVLLFGMNWEDFLSAKRLEFADLSRVRRALLERINRERSARRRSPLRPDSKLDAAAQRHAEDMLTRSYYGHDSPEGATVLERSKEAGYQPHFVAENLAQGQESIERVVADWMASAVHREHILSSLVSDVGSGVTVGTNAKGHQILWVQCFGRTKQ
jgi:hypothetical protein